jgi:hypothetical protein
MNLISNATARPSRKTLLFMGVGLLAAGSVVAAGILVSAERGPPEAEQADSDFKPQRAVPGQPPITKFPIKPVREVGDDLNPFELVLGVTVGGESRAYPINMLTGPKREILNDTLGGKAIAATW